MGKKKPTDWDWQAGQDALWQNYFREPSIEHRNSLVVHYQAWLRKEVRQFVGRRPGLPVEFDELLSAAQDGLLHSIPRYDPDRSATVKFTAFAALAIRGAMVDYLRRVDPIARSHRMRAQERSRAVDQLTQALGRSPSAEEVSQHLAAARITDTTVPRIGQLVIHPDQDDQAVLAEGLEGPAELDLTGEQFADLLKAVDLRAAAIIYHYHVQGRTMREIARFFSVSESWVCQLYRQGLIVARESLAARNAAE